jgi:uncharacterized membrane protein
LPGDPQSEALGINKRGEVAGNSGVFGLSRNLTDSTAVRWDRKGVATALPPLPGGDGSRAYGINVAGEVVGTSAVNGKWTAVIWDRAGFPRILAPLPGDSSSRGRAINNRGMAAGMSGGRAVIWSRDGTPRVLLPLEDQVGVEVWGINWRGDVVGTIIVAYKSEAAVIWERDSAPRLLEASIYEDLPYEHPVDYPSYARGIDSTREVVGYDGGEGNAALWDRSGTLISLPPLEGGWYSYAFAINRRGEVAGASSLYDGVPGFETEMAVVWR